MTILRLDDHNELEFRPTPWDEAVFGVPTREIVRIGVNSVNAGMSLLNQFDEQNRLQNVGLVFGRVNADDHVARQSLRDSGYEWVESHYELSVNLKTFSPEERLRRTMPFREASRDDLPRLREIAATAFHYGRFLEDPRIPKSMARARTAQWISDMLSQSKSIWVFEVRGVIVSFFALDATVRPADLILAGSAEGHGLWSLPFWIAVLTRLQESGVPRARTMISAANIGIVNLYVRLGFKFERLLVGMHKHYVRLNEPASALGK